MLVFKRVSNTKKIKICFLVAGLIWYYFSLPDPLFKTPYSTVIYSKEGRLLGAKIAFDQQWRFPVSDSIPEKFKQCVLNFEDEYFQYHWGFNPVSIYKALVENIRQNKVVRGGSTITQQVIRLSRKNKKRSYFEKFIELILATRLEFSYSKDEILSLYASHAPFGGNIVGLEMAAWRYFGRMPDQLSWAEQATLAVLPNAPAMIFPGKNQNQLKRKRNMLLKKLFKKKIIDRTTYSLALLEPLPKRKYQLPKISGHLLERLAKKHPGESLVTSIDFDLQIQVNKLAKQYYRSYKQNHVYNLAVLVVDLNNQSVVSYLGNSDTDSSHKKDVDIITSKRSTASTLKPFLFASMLDQGLTLSNTLWPDVPIYFSGFTPKNSSLKYDGAVAASEALYRSLNIPAVCMLKQYGIARFNNKVQSLGLKDINLGAQHYGLSLILGGAEASLWQLSQAYTQLAVELNFFTKNQSFYPTKFSPLKLLEQESKNIKQGKSFDPLTFSASSIWSTLQAMKHLGRVREDQSWHYYASANNISWKTGTSHGNRDAWAIGLNSDYLVGVWVGNATGEGRPNLTGVDYASPILFDVFNLFPKSKPFIKPLDDLKLMDVCKVSGFKAGVNCQIAKQEVGLNSRFSKICPYHISVSLDPKTGERVHSKCFNISKSIKKDWFVLPVKMAWYYKKNHLNYQTLPSFKEGCHSILKEKPLEFIYPSENLELILTKDFDGNRQAFIAKVAHQKPNQTVYWYLNKHYLKMTQHFHQVEILAPVGNHVLTAVDQDGNQIRAKFTILPND